MVKRRSGTLEPVVIRRGSAVRLEFGGLVVENPSVRGPFRDGEARYEARYRERQALRKEGVCGGDVVLTIDAQALRTEIDRQLSRGAKSKCCKSSPRCMRCPYVLAKLQRIKAAELDDAALRSALRQLRSA